MRSTLFFLAAISLAGCVNHEKPISTNPSEAININEIFKLNLESRIVKTLNSGMSFDNLIRELNSLNITVKADNELNNLKYTGPNLQSLNAHSFLEIISSNLNLDFSVLNIEDSTVKVEIFPNSIERFKIPKSNHPSKHLQLIEEIAQNKLLNKKFTYQNGEIKNVTLGSYELDVANSELIIAAPRSVKLDIIKEIKAANSYSPNTIAATINDNATVKDTTSESNTFRFTLKKGPIKPQLYTLLINHHVRINSTYDIHWLASDNFMWPNDYTVEGENVDFVINSILTPYKLVADFKGNGTVVIDNL